MGTQKGGHHPHRLTVASLAGHAHETQLGIAVEAVAAFRLYGSDSVAPEAFEVTQGIGQQLFFGSGAGGAHGAQNAPATGQDVEVGLAVQLALELIGAVAAEHQMGVALH